MEVSSASPQPAAPPSVTADRPHDNHDKEVNARTMKTTMAMATMLKTMTTTRTDTTMHYGTEPSHFETSIIHFPTSEGVSEVSERANE